MMRLRCGGDAEQADGRRDDSGAEGKKFDCGEACNDASQPGLVVGECLLFFSFADGVVLGEELPVPTVAFPEAAACDTAAT